MKHIIKYFIPLYLSGWSLFTSAQLPDSTQIVADSSFYANEIDSLENDSITGEIIPDIDDDPSDIFSKKMDSLLLNYDIQKRFQLSKEDTTFASFPQNLPDSVYIRRLQAIEQIVDLNYNQVVKNYITLYTEKRRDLVEVMLGLSAYYFPIFEETLDKYNMPLELKYLAIIESALNPMARSRAGAVGLWQFMYRTAKNLNLEITSFVDERRDPVKSTDAAARYLQKLYDIYGDWQLAIAAYNCGPGNVNKAIRRSGGKTNYWNIYYRLPRETRGYVPAFIAATYTFEYYKEHRLIPRYPELSLSVDTVMIYDYLHFDQISKKLGISKEELRNLNPIFRVDVIPAQKNKPYPLVLPTDKIMAFIDSDTAIFACQREKYFPNNTLINPQTASYFTPADVKGKARILYTVKTGDNVGFISSWFHVRAADLRYWNNIHRDIIRVGQKLVIYVPQTDKAKYEKLNHMTFAQKQASIGKFVRTTTQPKKNIPLDPKYVYYTVRKGDTLWEIAKKYAGISPDDLVRLNQLKNESSLYIGQKLKIKPKG